MKRNKKREKNKEELKQYLEKLSTKDNLTNDDAKILTDMIDKLVFGSKTERFVALISTFILKFLILFIVSLIASAFFLNQLVLDRYYIFLIAASIAFLLSIIETISSMTKKHGLKTFIYLMIGTFIFTLSFNYFIPIFKFDVIWVVYLLLIEIIYNLLMFTIFKKKLRS